MPLYMFYSKDLVELQKKIGGGQVVNPADEPNYLVHIVGEPTHFDQRCKRSLERAKWAPGSAKAKLHEVSRQGAKRCPG